MRPFSDFCARSSLTTILAIGFLLTLPNLLLAADLKPFVAHATGSIVSQDQCSATEVCQQSVVSGQATRLGNLTGILNERVNVFTGAYTGTAVFTITSGGTIETTYVGQVIPNPDGSAVFTESHVVVSATGRFTGMTGTLHVVGTASATGQLTIDGVGTLSR